MEEKIKIAAGEIVQRIIGLPIGSEFTFEDYFKDYDFKGKEQFTLMEEILKLCEEKEIEIENLQAGMTLGMPWAYKYKKKN